MAADVQSWTPALIALASALVTVGAVAGRIKGQEQTLKRHDDTLSLHSNRLSGHDIELAESRGWRKGYEARRDDREEDS